MKENYQVEESLPEKWIRGLMTFRNFEIASKRAEEIDRELRTAHNMPKTRFDALCAELARICTVREATFENLVVLKGRELFARRLVNDTTYNGIIQYGALGTGSGAVSSGDTQLGTEVFRKQIATRVRTNASITVDFYYSKADTSGTYNEFGMFTDATVTANSGQLFNRVLTGGWVKSSTVAMTVSCQVDLNAT